MLAYHVTDMESYGKIMADGWIRPMRLHNVYLFVSIEDAVGYRNEMGLNAILSCEVKPSQIEMRWKPKYAPSGVIKLYKDMIADNIRRSRNCRFESEGGDEKVN